MLLKANDIAHISYSHSDCKDVWKVYFSQMEKYWNVGMQNIFLVNKSNIKIPSRYTKYEYDEKKPYTKRLLDCLESLSNYKYIFFDHEDMFLYDSPDYEEINFYLQELFNNKYEYIKLIKTSNSSYKPVENSSTLFEFDFNSRWIFSIQPSFWNRDRLIDLINKIGDNTHWGFELKSQKYLKKLRIKSAFSHRQGKKRGIYHFDNNVYPYIATAIVKGQWNLKEYKSELEYILAKCEIDPNLRGYF